MENFGGKDPMDDSANIFSLERKQYREAISQNTATVFDFRNYLFARQCQLLFQLNRPIEVLQRSKVFITIFSRLLDTRKVKPFSI
jgi:hypothetical protein